MEPGMNFEDDCIVGDVDAVEPIDVTSLQKRIQELEKEVMLLNFSISLLNGYIDENRLAPYGSSTLKKDPKDMNSEELLERVRQVHSKKRVFSKDIPAQPNADALEKRYKSINAEKCSPIDNGINAVLRKFVGDLIRIEEAIGINKADEIKEVK
jgi:hypothetical protein